MTITNWKKILVAVAGIAVAGLVATGYITHSQADALLGLLVGVHGVISSTESPK